MIVFVKIAGFQKEVFQLFYLQTLFPYPSHKLLIMNKLVVVVAFIGLILSSSCRDEKESYSATIRVLTEDGIPVQNCNIRIDTPLQNDGKFELYLITDEGGYVSFTYPYKAFFEVTATKGFGWIGCSYVELINGEEVVKELTIYPFNASFNGCL
jgi:hypothetical protein